MTAMALILSIVESFIPFGVPGAKLGLANLIIMLAIYFFGFWTGLIIDIVRIVAASLATGTILGMGFVMSLAGGLLSFFLMYLLIRLAKLFTPVGVSVIGAYSHSLAQILVAVIYMGTWGVIWYFPLMAFISLATGTANGFIAEALLSNHFLAKHATAVFKRDRE